ncbi:transcriptional regulator [Sediminibacterium sp.]|uniref:winged helix-turn-helix domain-containing protein n=1 Tax=Sediminibacterium sp. TaxID=1917865 RepID=UPI0027338ED4|nr:transcriptional regulator [Sediminibacterium sp.]MDP3394709.1 transcriptional regulator [Sediminibacterium sp.]MDP3568544.1 transcriptional regulator [Sediminibacterium sp.]
MKNSIEALNKAFESRVRLGIMSILMVAESVDFGTLKAELKITDGNIASHISALEKLEYINVKKQFIGKKPNTTYIITAKGRKAFTLHIHALEKIIKQTL